MKARWVVAVPARRAAAGCGRQLAEQQPGGLGQEQRPVIQRQAQQRGEHGAHRQRAGPPGAVGQRGLDDRGLPAAVDQLGGERHGLLVRGAARPGDVQPAAAHDQPACRRLSQARKHGLGRGAVDVARVAGQRLGPADPGDGQQLGHRGARGQVIADETGPAPAQPQPGRGRISRQGTGEAGDEVLVAAVRRAGPEQVSMSRAAGQPGRPPGVIRGDRYHPRGRPADPDRHLAVAAGNVTAPQRHQLPGPQPGPDAEHHHGQRRGPLRRAALGSGESGQLSALGRRIRRGRFRPGKRRRPLPRRAVHRHREPVKRRPVRTPGRGRPAGQPGHAERLDHVIIQQELPAGPGSPAPWRTGTAPAPRWRPPPARRRLPHRQPALAPARPSLPSRRSITRDLSCNVYG